MFESTSGLEPSSLHSPASLTTMDSADSHKSVSTPSRRPQNTCCSVSPNNFDTPQSVSTPLDDFEMEPRMYEGKMLPFGSSMDSPGLPVSMDPSDSLLSERPLFDPPGEASNHASLSDLSLAAFVESLYTLEIAPSDGLTSNMLVTQLSENLSTDDPSVEKEKNQNLFPGVEENDTDVEYAQSAFLHENLAFSVPSDMRWWDAAWNLPQTADEPISAKVQNRGSLFQQVPQTGPPESLDFSSMLKAKPSIDSNSALGSRPEEYNTIKNSCCGKNSDSVTCASLQPSHVPSLHTRPTPDKVHCVPSPSGTHCSCRCDSGLALLSLERSLRHKMEDTPRDASKTSQNQAISSLVFTLSMSQSITQKCSCSVDCPTCKKDPSYRSSALLLISTALQIYARALQLFHDVLVADGPRSCCCNSSNNCCSCSGSSDSKSKRVAGTNPSIDVRIGDYLPSGPNSRKIALYALKLELMDLERALSRVHSAADRPLLPSSIEHREDLEQKECCAKESSSCNETTKGPLCLNPIDRLVIKKLHVQLNEVLHALNGMGIHDTFESNR